MRTPGLTDPEFDELLHAVTAARQGTLASVDMRLPRTPVRDPAPCQALLFIKPEGLSEDVHVASLISLVLSHARESELTVGGISVLGWTMMASGLMAAHYSVINRVSTLGAAALTKTAAEAVASLSEGNSLEVFGAHQAIERFGLSSVELLNLAEEAGIRKVAQGTYATVLRHPAPFIVLNAFHPAQLEHFTAPGAAVVAFDVGFGYPWLEFRDDVLGATDPREAVAGSLRRKLLDDASELNLREVSRNRNCVHGSGGPVEAMAEISRFFRLGLPQTQFGDQMLAAGFNDQDLDWAAANPTLEDGSSLFEATECVAPSEALQLLKSLRQVQRV